MNSNGGWRKVAIQPMISLPVFIPQPAPGTYDPPPLICSRMIKSEAHRGRIQAPLRCRHPLFLKLFYPPTMLCRWDAGFVILTVKFVKKIVWCYHSKETSFYYIPVVLLLYGASPYLRIGHLREYPPGCKGPSLIGLAPGFTQAPISLGPKDGNVTSYKSFLFHAVELNLGT